MNNQNKPYRRIIIINWKWKRKLLSSFPHLVRSESAEKDVATFKEQFEERFLIDPVQHPEEQTVNDGILRLKADLSKYTGAGIIELKEQLTEFIAHSTLQKAEQVLFFSHRKYLGSEPKQHYEQGWAYQHFLNLESVVYHLLDYNTGDYGIDVAEEIGEVKQINAELFSLVWDYAWTRWQEKLRHFYDHLSNYLLGVGKEHEGSIKIRVSNIAANYDSTGCQEFKEFRGHAYMAKLKNNVKVVDELDNMDLPAPYTYAGCIAQKDDTKVEDIRNVILTIARGDFTPANLMLAKNLIKEVV